MPPIAKGIRKEVAITKIRRPAPTDPAIQALKANALTTIVTFRLGHSSSNAEVVPQTME